MKHPEQVRTLVAHEPPASQELPDREQVLAACVDIRQTYERSGYGPAMAKFIALVSLEGPVPADFASQSPDPAAFGLPTEDDGSRNDPVVGQNIVSCNSYLHDFDAVRSASTRVVVAVGAESGTSLVRRAGEAVAERLGVPPTIVPGDHGAMMGEPDDLAAKLREILAPSRR